PARDCYHPETFHQLQLIYSYVLSVQSTRRQRLLFTLFSSILILCTSQQKHWGWVCDNVRPRKHIYVDAFGVFFKALEVATQAFIDLERDTHVFLAAASLKALRARPRVRLDYA